MANVGTYRITAITHTNIETATGITLDSDYIYRFQSYDNEFWLREGTSGDGDCVPMKKWAYVEPAEDDLYIKTSPSGVTLNIARSPKN